MRCNTICLVSWGPYQWIFPLPKKRGVLCNEHRRLVYYDLAIKISFSSPNCWQKGPVRKAIRMYRLPVALSDGSGYPSSGIHPEKWVECNLSEEF